ncbi:MAG: tRNA pseudouridine(38-40) synthase TruA [Saprospiraceae bacterium]
MRYQLILSFMGTNYSGWQKQPGSASVQQTLEEAFSMILRQPIGITGCGRTDAGVHARTYFAHFDADGLEKDFMKLTYQVNAVLPVDISLWVCKPLHYDFHARFDAISRSYKYSIHYQKDPFLYDRSYFINNPTELNKDKMNEVASLIMQYEEFLPFCKTGSDNKNYKCQITESEWQFEEQHCYYSVTANRFLRGMVRLIVGACLNAGYGKISVETIKDCLDKQIPLPLQLSVSPQGLCFLCAEYPPAP